MRDMTPQEDLIREQQRNADDIRHLQNDLKEFKQETNMKFDDLGEEHNSLKETLQGMRLAVDRLNDTLKVIGEQLKPVHDEHLVNKLGPAWMKQTLANMKLYAILAAGALVVWKIDVIMPFVLKALGK